jgi:hypothetical protein
VGTLAFLFFYHYFFCPRKHGGIAVGSQGIPKHFPKYNRLGYKSQIATVSLVVERRLLLNHGKGLTPHN